MEIDYFKKLLIIQIRFLDKYFCERSYTVQLHTTNALNTMKFKAFWLNI